MIYYKVKKESSTGVKLCALLKQIAEVDKVADDLAKQVGADAYLPHEYGDYGGMMAVSFPEKSRPSLKLWELVGQMNDGHKYYVPKVRVTEEWMPSHQAVEYEFSSRHLVEDKEVKYKDMIGVFSREQAAMFAGLQLTTYSVEALARKYNIENKNLYLIRAGVSAQHVLEGYADHVIAEFMRSQVEDMSINEKLSEISFRRVETIEGHSKAVSFYKKFMRLPIIPMGCTNAICQVDDNKHRCGIMESDDFIYITAGEESTCADFLSVSEEEFVLHINKYSNER